MTVKDPFHLETGDTHAFLFDNVFTEEDSQANLFDNTSKNIYDTMTSGKNAAVIAYGSASKPLIRNWQNIHTIWRAKYS